MIYPSYNTNYYLNVFIDFFDKFLFVSCNEIKKLILEIFFRPGHTIEELHPGGFSQIKLYFLLTLLSVYLVLKCLTPPEYVMHTLTHDDCLLSECTSIMGHCLSYYSERTSYAYSLIIYNFRHLSTSEA